MSRLACSTDSAQRLLVVACELNFGDCNCTQPVNLSIPHWLLHTERAQHVRLSVPDLLFGTNLMLSVHCWMWPGQIRHAIALMQGGVEGSSDA